MAQSAKHSRPAGAWFGLTVVIVVAIAIALAILHPGQHHAGTPAGRAESIPASDSTSPDPYESKLAILASESAANEEQKQNAPRTPKRTDPSALNTAVSGCVPPPTDQGLTNNRESTLNKGILDVTSGWTQTINSTFYAVYAGAPPSDHSEGTLAVQEFAPCGGEKRVTLYKAPIVDAGPLTIVSAENNVLNLTTGDGLKLTFDVERRQFV